MIYGLLGKTLSYSYSPRIHKALGSFPYDLIERSEEGARVFLEEKKFKGINVTNPYKKLALDYLDEIDESVMKTSCLNIVLNDKGVLKGYNADYFGFLYSFRKFKISEGKVLIVGDGATAGTVRVALEDQGFKDIKSVSRTGPHKINDVEYFKDREILINATPLGMFPKDKDKYPINLKNIKNLKAVMDLNYNPLETRLLAQAKELDIKAMSGLLMLIAQAKYSSEIFQGKKIEENQIEEIYKEMLENL